MNVSKLVTFDIRRITSSWFFYMALGLSFLSAFGIAYSIKHLEGPFTMNHVTSLYSLFGSLFSAVIAMRLFSVDLSSETITLLLNTKLNRLRYCLSKLLGFGVVGLIFGAFCAVTIFLLKNYIGAEVELALYGKAILNYGLFSMFYATLFFFISLFYRNITVLFAVAVLAISFLPDVLGNILNADLPNVVESLIEYSPLYFFPTLVASHNLELSQYAIVLGSIVLLAVLSLVFIRKRDY